MNSTTSSALTDMGGGATFFDNMVEVRAVDPSADGSIRDMFDSDLVASSAADWSLRSRLQPAQR